MHRWIHDVMNMATGMAVYAAGIVANAQAVQVAGVLVAGIGVACSLSREIRHWLDRKK